MSETHFSAQPADGGVLVTMSPEFAAGMVRALSLTAKAFSPGSIVFGLRWPRYAMTRLPLLRRVFPKAGGSWWQSAAFRWRYREELADSEPVERVRDRCAGPGPMLLSFAEADEWIVVMGQARTLHRLFRKATREHVMTFSSVQCALVKALLTQDCPCPAGAARAEKNNTCEQ